LQYQKRPQFCTIRLAFKRSCFETFLKSMAIDV
jgi:hypothetical protein